MHVLNVKYTGRWSDHGLLQRAAQQNVLCTMGVRRKDSEWQKLPNLFNTWKFIHVDDLLREMLDLECGVTVYLFVQSLL
jgi:hypothetical protein